MERRLAAILAADVVGYSRLMEADEEATVRTLNACRQVIDGLVADHRGRVFGSAGDSMVAEFPSPVEAVRCAVDIQRELEAHNVDLPEDRRMRLRVGINLGDVIVEGDNLLGDGVNIAARLEMLADAGGICLSGPVFDQIKKQLDLGYEYLGEHEVKNIAEPVRVYRVLTEPEAAGKIIGETRRAKQAWKQVALAAAAVVLIGVAAAVTWLRPWEPTVEPASVERMTFPLPDKPSIAVLPFNNLSGDAGQSHMVDGLTEDITTALSQVSSLFVIARNSSFAYKGKPVKVQRVAEDLGVRYVLEGSVQTSGDQVRITAQLIDALTGNHLWAERYDRNMTELFALQDEITDRIVIALRIKLTEGEEARVHRKHTRSVEAWNLLSRGHEHFHRVNKTDNATARQLFKKAIEVDNGYALAYALLAWTHWFDAFHGWRENRELSFERASFLAEKARALDDALPDVYALQGAIHLFKREYDEAIEAGEKAVAYNPNHATNTALLAMILHNAGRPKEAIRKFKTAMRLSPYYPAWFLEVLGFTYLDAKQPDEALVAFAKFLERKPNALHAAHSYIGRALAYHALGQDDEARAEVAKAVEADTGVSLTEFRQHSLNKDRAGLERGLATLRWLGLPE
ncbi:MAG: adenylate/guanylate cyclase domain-containing protein [Alphaproteobacteria bacterium]